MKHYLTLILSVFLLNSLFAQEELRLLSSRYSTIIEQKGFSSIQPVYLHKGNTLSADSGIIYQDAIGRQFFEAFGNVVITQPSGTTIYADKLHYDATPQIATLYNNIRMVSPSSVLTTNHLIYKMRDRVGTYTGGGRIISRGDTITSKTAYYFEDTQDAYFRNKVIVRTPDVKIYTDTMRYNANMRMTHFFGPTNIKGNKAENLYTEKGNYNTETGIAKFSKNNLYTEGSRFLKGDSLYYERQTGVGEAFKNVVFVDTSDKFYAYGGYGVYNQVEGSITMTDKPLIISVVKKDSTDNSSADSSSIANLEKDKKKDKKTKVNKDKELEKVAAVETQEPAELLLSPPLMDKPAEVDSIYMTADTLYSRLILLKDYKALHFNLDRNGGELDVDKDVDYGDDDDEEGQEFIDPELGIEQDSIKLSAAKAIGTEILPKKLKEVEKKLAPATKKTDPLLSIDKTLKQDSILRQKAVIPQLAEAETRINDALSVAKTSDTTNLVQKDSAYLDTAQTRIVKAYHNVRMFKSDLQAVADSAYYGMADSMFRFMGKPMIWAQGSQITADTIYMQALDGKLDNALLVGNAFMVNVVLDSLKFNQLKGRKITAFFANNNIERIFVDGNAENLIFSTNDVTNTITEMFHDRGARIKIKMENKKIIDYISIRKVDQKVYPFKLVTQENEVLPGFVWRPQDRPISKEDMMNRKREVQKEAVKAEGNKGEEKDSTTDHPSTDSLDKKVEIKEVENTEVKIEQASEKQLQKKDKGLVN